MQPEPHIFISYAREDAEQVDKLYARLEEAGLRPWQDKRNIVGGERWSSEIRRAIENAGFFLACLSSNSIYKRGVIQKEIRYALDVQKGKLDSDIYIIPVRL